MQHVRASDDRNRGNIRLVLSALVKCGMLEPVMIETGVTRRFGEAYRACYTYLLLETSDCVSAMRARTMSYMKYTSSLKAHNLP